MGVNMMDYEKVIRALEDENKRVDTTEWQRSANLHRIQWIRLMNRPKQPAEPYVSLDLVSERLKNPEFTCRPNSLLQK